MPMELGSGIALGGLCVSAAAVAITAIRSKAAEKKDESMGKGHCLDHSGIDVCLKGVNQRLDGVDNWLGEISKDVKELGKKIK